MKNFRRNTALLLCMLMLLQGVSCSNNSAQTETDDLGAASATAQSDGDIVEETVEEEDEDSRASVKDNLPDDLDFEGKTMRVICRAGDDDTTMEFVAEELNGEVVNDAVYTRNLNVEERLNVTIELNEQNVTCHSHMSSTIQANVVAGADEYDLIADGMYGEMPNTLNGYFLDLNSVNYIDLSMPWYNKGFNESTGFFGKNYAVMGDLGTTMLAGSYVMFFNNQYLNELTNSKYNMYQIVLDGEWTIDKLADISAELYTDSNGNGEVDDGDIVGHFYTNTDTLEADAFFGASHVMTYELQEDGTIVFNGANDRMVEFAEKMEKLLFENNSTLKTPNNNEQIMDTLKSRNTLFNSWMLGSGVTYLRDMDDDFGILPMPKLNEEQDQYYTYSHDGVTIFLIPVTAKETDSIGAFLEAMSAESYRTVTTAYFETALKTKYSRDSESSQMLDIISEGVYDDIMYIYGSTLPMAIGSVRSILNTTSNLESVVSTFTKSEKAAQKSAEKIVNKYKELAEGE